VPVAALARPISLRSRWLSGIQSYYFIVNRVILQRPNSVILYICHDQTAFHSLGSGSQYLADGEPSSFNSIKTAATSSHFVLFLAC